MPVTLPEYIHIDLSKIDPSRAFSTLGTFDYPLCHVDVDSADPQYNEDCMDREMDVQKIVYSHLESAGYREGKVLIVGCEIVYYVKPRAFVEAGL